MKTRLALNYLLIILLLCVGLKSTAQVVNYYSYTPKTFFDSQGNSSTINDLQFIQNNSIYVIIKNNNESLYLSIGQMDNLDMFSSLTMGPIGGLMDEPLNGHRKNYYLEFKKTDGQWNEYYSKLYNEYFRISKNMKKRTSRFFRCICLN